MNFSFVIPIYNGDKFIEKCVQSILNQPLRPNDFEIIIVDDGSKDRSVEICESLAKKNAEIKFFTKANAGPGHTRNYGMDRATGKYIWFIDADDYLEEGVVPKVYEGIESQLKLYIFGYRAIDLKGNSLREVKYEEEVLRPEEALNRNYFVNMVWCKLISLELLQKTGVRFREDIRGPEDFHLSFRLMFSTDKIGFLNFIGYNYIENPASLMNTRSEAHMIKLGEDSMTAGTDLSSFLADYPSSHKKMAFNRWLSNFFFGLLYSYFRFNYSPVFVANSITKLKKIGNYPIRIKASGFKKRLFIMVCNSRSLFLFLIKLRH